MRKIIHIDMDAFFTSVEKMDNPKLLKKPIAVGGNGERGVVAAASYEARKFGVTSAMPSLIAKKKCPQLIFLPTRMERYKEVSKEIMKIFYEFTDLVEQVSIDEAFLDVTQNKKNSSFATYIAKEIKREISKRTSLTSSAGVSINKFLAKVASDYKKPDGLFVISPKEVSGFMDNLEIDKFYGVGKVTAKKMKDLGIFYGRDLKKFSLSRLISFFGKQGSYYYYIAQGIDFREVNQNRVRKSISAESTFKNNINGINDISRELLKVLDTLCERLAKNSFRGKTLTLKIKYADFKEETRSQTVIYELKDKKTIEPLVYSLLKRKPLKAEIRLLGLGVSNRVNQTNQRQLTIF